MSDLLKIIGIIFALPVFIIVVLGLIISSWSEGLIIEEILKALEVNPFVIVLISIIGVIVLFLSIIIVAKNIF